MSEEHPITPAESGLVIRPSTGLISLPEGGSQALSEIISRSLAHIRPSRALVVTAPRAGDEKDFEIAPGVNIAMCWIPAGEFLFGSPENEEGRFENEKQRRVRITNGFWLAKTPTTQAQWATVMGENPSNFKRGDFPVELVSWLDICGNDTRTGGFLGKINQGVSVGERFDLPTEVQWEYACRSGTTAPYYGDLDEIAWYEKNSGGKTQLVGCKRPNYWGLQDMIGNVTEWCADYFGEYSDSGAIKGPILGKFRVVRGACYGSGALYCRAAYRSGYKPHSTGITFGFRLVRSSLPKSA